MLKLKERKKECFTSSKSQGRITKKSIFKKIAISSILLFSAVATWDMAVTASNIHHAKQLVDYKYNYYNSLENYNTLKNKINSKPYTDADFKRDLNIFSHLYGNDKYSEGFRKYLQVKNTATINMNYILLMNNRYNNTDKMIDEINNYLKDVPLEKIGDWKNYRELNEGVSKIYSKYEKTSEQKRGKLYSDLKMQRSKYLGLDDKVYDNFSRILVSEGFNPNSFVVSKESLKLMQNAWENNRADTEKQAIIYKELDNQAIKNNELAIKYYKEGNLTKLRELFRLGNGFLKVIVDEPGLKTVDTQFGYTLSSIALYYSGFGDDESTLYDYAKQAGLYVKYTGQMKPGQEKYYENIFSMINE